MPTKVKKPISISEPPVVKISYNKLKALKNAGNLRAGLFYRITDYITTTAQKGTRSAGHQFDLLVLALSHNTLSEEAKAIIHDGDTYFANSRLEAWKVWYSLENDKSRFSWAKSNGKGIIYRMIDEYGNDCPYDFKNIQFLRNTDWLQENTNWCYDVLGKVPNKDTFFYTFSWYNEDSEIQDLSSMWQTIGNYYSYDERQGCCENHIRINLASFQSMLNDIVLVSSYFFDSGRLMGCYCNSFGSDCDNITFGNGCFYNSFGNACSDIIFGNYCYLNSFGNECSDITFGNQCDDNTFGNSCADNNFGDGCIYNNFGNYCYENSLGNFCRSNTFGAYCRENNIQGFIEESYFEGNLRLVDISGGTASAPIKFCRVLHGTKGTYDSPQIINFEANKGYCQQAGIDSNGNLQIWTPADIASILHKH